MKLNIKSFALTAGLFWGFGLLFITWWIILFEGASGDITLVGKVYRGFNISFGGSLIGFRLGLCRRHYRRRPVRLVIQYALCPPVR